MAIIALAVSITASAQTTAQGYYKGDVNNDKVVNIVDVAQLVKVLKGEATANDACYVDNDKQVTLSDLSELLDIVLGKKQKVWVNTNTIPSGDPNDKPQPGEDGYIDTQAKGR